MSTEQERRAVIQGMVDGKRDWSRDRTPESWTAIEAEADGAITALDAHRAEAVKAAVEKLVQSAFSWGAAGTEDDIGSSMWQTTFARQELLALFGIDDEL